MFAPTLLSNTCPAILVANVIVLEDAFPAHPTRSERGKEKMLCFLIVSLKVVGPPMRKITPEQVESIKQQLEKNREKEKKEIGERLAKK